MANDMDDLKNPVQVVEKTLDRINERFDAVDHATREQREYTEFAFTQLETRLGTRMETGFGRLEVRINVGLSELESKMDTGFLRQRAEMDVSASRH